MLVLAAPHRRQPTQAPPTRPEVAGDDGSVAAPQFPRTRRPAHRGALRLPARPARPVGVGPELPGRPRQPLVSELVTHAVDAAADGGGQVVSLHLSGHATQVLIEVQDPSGQVVRRELTAAPPEPPAASLPRRIPSARPKPQAEIATDLDILRRLRDHLGS